MYAIEFETDVKDQYIKIPSNEKFKFKHVKVFLMANPVNVEQKDKFDFNDLIGRLEWKGDALAIQKELRNEW